MTWRSEKYRRAVAANKARRRLEVIVRRQSAAIPLRGLDGWPKERVCPTDEERAAYKAKAKAQMARNGTKDWFDEAVAKRHTRTIQPSASVVSDGTDSEAASLLAGSSLT
jgi:hypothetical protein